MENSINKENKDDYNSILQKISHKPLIVEYIFSFIKDKPYKFLLLMEKDKTLKDLINSQFASVNKKNSFTEETNENIQTLIIYKKFKETLHQYKDLDASILVNYAFEENIIKNNSDPSFLIYKSKYILNQIKGNNILKNISIEGLTQIAFNEKEKYEHIELVLLSAEKKKFQDGLYLEKNLINENDLNNNCLNKEIDVLYCIIDDNDYYLDNIPHINKNIVINELYFIYIKGIKDINIYNAIKKYLNVLNKKNIKQITFGNSFYKSDIDKIDGYNKYEKFERCPIIQMINDALIKEKKYNLPFPISINLSMKKFSGFYESQLKFCLGIYFLFGRKIDDVIEVYNKSYHSNMLEKIENSKPNLLIIKYKGISSLDDENFNKFIKKCLKIKIPNVIFYIAKEENCNKKKTENVITFKLDDIRNYLLYSEIPNKYLHLEYNFNYNFEYYEVTDSYDNIILQESINFSSYNYLINHLFLVKKYKNLCFKWIYNENTYYKMYFIKKEFYYDIFIVNKSLVEKWYNEENDLTKYIEKKIRVYFNEVIKYCKENLHLKIDTIKNDGFPYEWSDVLKIKNKTKNKCKNKNKNQKPGENLNFKKINQKKMLDYELEEDEYYDDDENEEEEGNDDIPDNNN